MPFEKGHEKIGGRKKGSKDKKTLQWEAIGEWLANEGSERYMKLLQQLEDDKYLNEFKAIIEYFKPKQQRTQIEGNMKSDIIIRFDKEDSGL